MNAAPRVLFVSNYLPPQVVGGAELSTWQEMRGLAARGYEVRGLTVAWPGIEPMTGMGDGPDDPPVVRVSASSRGYWPPFEFRPDPPLEDALHALLAETRPDIVHLQNISGLSLRLPDVVLRAGVPLVWTIRDAWGVCPNALLLKPDGTRCPGSMALACAPCLAAARRSRSSFRRRAMTVVRNRRVRRLLARCDRLLFPSAHHRDLYVRAGLRADRTRLLPNPAGEGLGSEAPPPASAPDRPLRLLFLGSLRPHKGMDVLLQVLARLPRGTAHLTIHGGAEPERLAAFQRTVAERGLSGQVEHLGLLPYDRVGEALRATDLMVVPSVCVENSPRTIIDALVEHRPVLASRVGGIPELVEDGRNGRLVPPGDVAALAAAIADLAADREAVRRMGAEGPRRLGDRGMEAHLDCLGAIYGDLLGDRPGVPAPAPTRTVAPGAARSSLRLAMAHPALDNGGGAERIVAWMSRGLIARGHRVEVWTDRYDPARWSPPELEGVPVRLLQAGLCARLSRTKVLRERSIGRALGRHLDDVDLLVVHNSPSGRWASALDRPDLPVLWFCEEPFRRLHYTVTDRHTLTVLDGPPERNRHLRPFVETLVLRGRRRRAHRDRRREEAAVRRLTRIAANSAFTARNVEALFQRPASACPLGIPPIPSEKAPPPREGFVLAVGPPTPLKNVHNVVEAIVNLNAGGRPTDLVVTGRPDASLVERVRAAALADRIRFPGRVSDEELARLYATCSLVAFTPVDEPFGLIAVEAMARGAPVVASDHGGPAETVVDGETGLLVDPLDVDAIARAIAGLLDDPARREALGAAGRRRYETHYTFDAFLDRFEAECQATLLEAHR